MIHNTSFQFLGLFQISLVSYNFIPIPGTDLVPDHMIETEGGDGTVKTRTVTAIIGGAGLGLGPDLLVAMRGGKEAKLVGGLRSHPNPSYPIYTMERSPAS